MKEKFLGGSAPSHSRETGGSLPPPEQLIDLWHEFFRVANLSPDVCERLDQLDDIIFAAIEGDADAFDRALVTWEATRQDLGDELLEESRGQYRRKAQSVWDELHNKPHQTPHKSFAALEILKMLEGQIGNDPNE